MAANQSVESAETLPPPAITNTDRAAELRRINWLSIYLPITLATVLGLLLLGGLAWTALFTDGGLPTQIDRASGIADIFLTLVCLIPLTLICAILPLGGLGFLYWRQQNGSILRERTQSLFHKVDEGLTQADTKLNETTPKIAQPIIQARARLAGGFVLLDKLINAVKNGTSNQTNTPPSDSGQSEQSE